MNSVGGMNDLRGDFVWLHGSRGVAESAEENKSNCDNPIATGSTESSEEPGNLLKCLAMNNLHAKPTLFPSAAINANQGKSGYKYRIPNLKSASVPCQHSESLNSLFLVTNHYPLFALPGISRLGFHGFLTSAATNDD
jgi:hypothetical protein